MQIDDELDKEIEQIIKRLQECVGVSETLLSSVTSVAEAEMWESSITAKPTVDLVNRSTL